MRATCSPPKSRETPYTNNPDAPIKCLRADDIVEFERLVDLAEPFGAVGGAATAALVEREFQLAQQARNLLARGDVTEIRPGAERGLVEVVERGEPAREKLAVHHPLRETVDGAEAEAGREIVEAVGDELLVARTEHRQAVANHDPVGGGAVELTPLAPDIPHHLRIMALAGHRVGFRIDGAEHVKIEEAVVDRRHQGVGHRMREPHQITVRTRGVDHDKIKGPLDRAHGVRELLEFARFVLGDLHGLAELDAAMHGDFEIEAGAARPGASVVDVTGETLLAAVEIDGGDALAGFHQGNGDVQGGGGFSRTALLVAEHNDMRRTGLSLTSLQQHIPHPQTHLQITGDHGQVKCATTSANRCWCDLIMNRLTKSAPSRPNRPSSGDIRPDSSIG